MKKTIIIILISVGILATPILWFSFKEWQTQRNLKQAFSVIKIPSDYRVTGSVCGNEEFKPFCEYRFYSSEPLDISTAKISKLLSDAGYVMSYKAGGLDGPNQQAYTGYNEKFKTSLTYKEIERGKYIQYEQGYGNVQFRIYK